MPGGLEWGRTSQYIAFHLTLNPDMAVFCISSFHPAVPLMSRTWRGLHDSRGVGCMIAGMRNERRGRRET